MKRRRQFDRSLGKKRKLCGLTQHEVARQANIPINRIVFAETGRIELEPDELERVRNVFRQRLKKAFVAVA